MASRPRRSAAAPKRFSPPPVSITPKKDRKVKEEIKDEPIEEIADEQVEELTVEDVINIPEESIVAKLSEIEPVEYSVPDILLERAAKSRKRANEEKIQEKSQKPAKTPKLTPKKVPEIQEPVMAKEPKTEVVKKTVVEKPKTVVEKSKTVVEKPKTVVEKPKTVVEKSKSPSPLSTGMPKLVFDTPVPLPQISPSTTTTIIAQRSTTIPTPIETPSTSSSSLAKESTLKPKTSLSKPELSSKNQKIVNKKVEVSRKPSNESIQQLSKKQNIPMAAHSKTSVGPTTKSLNPPQKPIINQQQKPSKPQSSSTPSFKQPSPSIPKPTNAQKPSLKSPIPSSSLSKKPVVKRIVPQPSSSFGLGLLDDILDNQDYLLKDRNKTEQQKSDERQRLEFERRRVSAENPFEKAAALNDRRKSSNLITPPIVSKPQSIPPSKKSSTTPPIIPSNEVKQKSPEVQVQASSPKPIPEPVKTIIEPTVSTSSSELIIDTVDKTVSISVEVSNQSVSEIMEEIPQSPSSDSGNAPVIQFEEVKQIEQTENIIQVEEEVPMEIEPEIEVEKEIQPALEEQIDEDEVLPETAEEESLPTDESTSNDSIPTENNVTGPLSIDVSNQDLLKTAEEVLKDFQLKRSDLSNISMSTLDITYEQIEVSDAESTESAKVEPEEKVSMDFYGEPIPDDDENDDFFEIAAGITKPKKSEIKKPIDEEPLPDNEMIELDYYNADMNIKSDAKKKWLIDPENGDGFALMYGCVRSNFGLKLPNHTADRSSLPEFIVYQVMISEYLPMKHLPFEESEPFDLRVGWSDESVKKLVGEAAGSYAYCVAGRKASGNVFEDYGRNAKVGDIITVVLDVINNEMRIFLNNEDLGVMFTDLRFNDQFSNSDHTIISPHIGVKNLKVFVNFGVELPDPEVDVRWPLPAFLTDKSYKFFGDFSKCANILVPTPRAPPSKSDCTVIFMVGLPAAGKSKWVENYLREHSSERWIVLNSEVMLEFMKVNGVSRKRVHQGRWDAIMGLAGKSASRALQLVCRRRHNYIIDQTNISRDARKRKLGYFQDFIRKCVVLVPSADDFEHRQMKQARDDPTDQIPPEALLQLKGMFTLPETDQEPVDEVIFVEPPADRLGDAVEMIRRFNDEGRPYLPMYNQKRK